MSSLSSSRLPVAFLLGTLSLLSAFLLFQVQPVISKYILPWFGGSPGVWTTCMVFFQIVLFAGYTYAHLLTKLRPRTQAIIHSGLMLAALALLPIAPGDAWKPAGNEDPAGRILLLLLGTVGLPYFILSSTSPLAQVWFTRAVPGGTPWRLYALSNIGSLAALLSYPFFFEPRLEVTTQTWLWSGAFVVFAALSATLAWKVNSPAPDAEIGEKASAPAAEEAAPRWWHRLLWLALPALASVMLLATTNHVCQDVAVVPFMWVVPLSLYLLTFILCFEHERWYVRGLWALGVLAVVFITAAEKHLGGGLDLTPDYLAEIAWCFGAMFLACMVCHGELARLKPAPSRLTEFYLMMSAGGAAGGLLVSLVAPRVFVTYLEWPLALILSLVAGGVVVLRGLWQLSFRGLFITLGALGLGILISDRLLAAQLGKGSWVMEFFRLVYGHLETTLDGVNWAKRPAFPDPTAPWVMAWVLLSLGLMYAAWTVYRLVREQGRNSLHLLAEVLLLALLLPALIFLPMKTLPVEDRLERVRNFYGTVYVDEDYDTGLENEYRTLTHGGIVHGMQNLGDLYREEPVTYYGRHTGIGRALGRLAEQKGAKVGIVGLGAGTAACYAQADHDFRFYEINPDVARLARQHFTYLADAEKRGSAVTTIIGDARLMLEREPSQQFDVLLLDAFSGDAIPMHLLTREAFEIYHRHMKPDGIIVVHVTNSYLILAPVVKKQADAMGWKTTRIITAQMGDDDDTDYMLVTQNEAFLKNTPADEPDNEPKLDVPLWTDRYHNLFQILLTGEN